jgi:hypothetical protein
MAPRAPVVAPFYRASITIGPVERRLFDRGLDEAAFVDAVRALPWIPRQNLRRLFAAARLAETLGASILTVEGWRSNAVERARSRSARFVSGSWVFALFLRLLRRRGLIARVPLIRRDVSRCTWEEARGLQEVAGGRPIIGVSDNPCPSAPRASRYLKAAGSAVISSSAAVSRAGLPSSALRALWDALQPNPREAILAPIVEAPNWVLHLTSEALGVIGLREPPLEVRLARALRADRR